MPWKDPTKCKHSKEWLCLESGDGPTNCFVCMECELFTLNFDPVKYPVGVAYTADRMGEKKVELASSKY